MSDYLHLDNESMSMYEGWENSKDDAFCEEEVEVTENLFNGWRFDKIEEAEDLYYSYAQKLGFKVRRQSMKCRPCGTVRYREWVCSCEGFKICNEKPLQRGPKTETRCGCKARFRVAHDQRGQVYKVTDFVTEHNHDLDESRGIKRNRDNCEKQTTNDILNELKPHQGKRIASSPTLEDLLSFSSTGQHQNPTKPTDAMSMNGILNKPKPEGCKRTATSPTLEDFLATSSQRQRHNPTKARDATTTNEILNKPKPQGGKRPVVSPSLKDFLSTSSLSPGLQQNPTKSLDKGKECCHFEKLILEIQTLTNEIQTIKSDMPNIIDEKIRSLIPPLLKQCFHNNATLSPAYKTKDSSPTSTKKRARILNSEQSNGHIPNFIDASNLEDEPVKAENNIWCNPEAADELIIEFLFDEKLDNCSTVVNFGREHLSRYDIKSLQPKNLVIDSVIDCVAYMASMNHNADNPIRSSFFLSSRFADYVFQDKYEDAELVDWFLREDEDLREDEEFKVETLEKIYIPINDTHRHWYLAIIDLDATTIMICDTRPTPMLMDFRKNQVIKIANKLGLLIGKGKIGNTFSYEYPKWVPFQTNVYDCGLYVCLMLLLRDKMNKELEKAESVIARRVLAKLLYINRSNSVAWDRH